MNDSSNDLRNRSLPTSSRARPRLRAEVAAVLALGFVGAMALSTEARAAEGAFDDSVPPAPTVALTMAPTQTGAVGVRVTVNERRGQQTRVERFDCVLAHGAVSSSLECGAFAPIQVAFQKLSNGKLRTTVPLLELHRKLTAQGWLIESLAGTAPPPTVASPAEGTWTGWGPFGMWDCELEASDVTSCNATCGGSNRVESLTTEPEIPSNNPFLEPSCKTTCECTDGVEHVNIDPPQVQPAF